jgi:hypothetical protein
VTCRSQFYLSATNQCLACPSGGISPEGNSLGKCRFRCSATSQGCATCASDGIRCLQCESNRILNNGVCIECPVGQFNTGGTSITCLPCNSNCYRCYGSSTNCISCYMGFKISSGTCIACGTGYSADDFTESSCYTSCTDG